MSIQSSKEKIAKLAEQIKLEEQKMVDKGATILGGCCESKPSHINKISTLKN